MDVARFIDHPLLKQCRREYRVGEFLFRQSDTGQSMFMIHSGSVRLTHMLEGKPVYTAAMVEAGDLLGERVVLNDQPHPRFFNAVAETEVMAVEIGAGEVALMEREAPYLVKSLMKGALEVAEKRLERANQLISVLRSSNNDERLRNCLQVVASTLGRNTQEGIEIASLAANLHMQIDMPLEAISARLNELVRKGVLLDKGQGVFVVPDLAKLHQRP
jgi:CRP-like cAMP-binding protein